MLSAWYYSIPAVTRWLLTGMSCLLLVTWLIGRPSSWCLSPMSFPSLSSLITLITSTYTHLSFFHLFFNMSVLVHYGGIYELKWGSMKFLLNVFILGILCNLVHLVAAFLLEILPYNPIFVLQNLVWTCSLGFSGVLFAFISIDCFDPAVTSTDRLQVFGLMPVPKKYYPWIMLGLMQLMLSNVSFLGHLSGLLIGLLYSRDSYRILHIKRVWVEFFENTGLSQVFLVTRPMWIPRNKLPGNDAPPPVTFTEALQKQLQSFYPSHSPPPGPIPADRAAPATPESASNITSFSQLPRDSKPTSSIPHRSAASSSTASSSTAPSFPGEGHKLGGH